MQAAVLINAFQFARVIVLHYVKVIVEVKQMLPALDVKQLALRIVMTLALELAALAALELARLLVKAIVRVAARIIVIALVVVIV